MTVLTLLVAHSISEKVSCVYLDTGFIPFFYNLEMILERTNVIDLLKVDMTGQSGN